jgi:NAD(P)-dependent dehydrogenase (short-subunit alcohol dehydrogenase family)
LILRFLEEHLRRFSLASLDFNPLHLSETYAHKSPFGERVVYGMLAFMACLSKVPLPAGRVPSHVEITFKAPQLLNLDYTLELAQEPSRNFSAALRDGSATVMEFRLQLREGSPELVDLPEIGMAPGSEARQLAMSQLTPGLSFHGEYAPGRVAYLELLSFLGVERSQWGDALLLTALCTSYLTGMELPGESASYSGLRAELLPTRPDPPTEFSIGLDRYDRRFGLLHSIFTLGAAGRVYSKGEIAAISRPATPVISAPAFSGTGPFWGKTALVIGASRGLGAAMSLELVAQGCTVVAVYAHSTQAAETLLAASSGLQGRLLLEQGDAADLQWCVALKDRLRAEFRGLDLLVCGAAPALQPLRVEDVCYERVASYLQKAFALVAAPLSTFLEMVATSSGRVLLISSSAVEKPPRMWPHYVSTKCAAEGLVRSAAADNSRVTFWIARPNRILTDMTNTPVGRLNAEEAPVVARRILQHVGTELAPGTVQFCS